MSLVFGIFFGILAGLIANRILPGQAPGGILLTVIISVTAALAGGLLAITFSLGNDRQFDVPTLAFAMIGSISSLFCFRLYVDRHKY